MCSKTENMAASGAVNASHKTEEADRQNAAFMKRPKDGDEIDANTVIQVQDLSKCYQVYEKPYDRLKQSLYPKLQKIVGKVPKQYHREFWALKNVSFEVERGKTVGIIGRNGSGKSTLLQIICGTLAATAGSVKTKGRITALLELGSGFNPEFTGRENVYMNGAILGLSKKEIDDRFDLIASFADIGQFIDQPVKTYSSGMAVRLAFAVQAQVDPSILVVDEALAVGDPKFQAKCFARLHQLKENGASILLVTHSTEQIVTHCSAAMLLDQGVQLDMGEPKRVVNIYMDLLFGKKKGPFKAVGQTTPEPSNALEQTTVQSKYLDQLSNANDHFATHSGYNSHEYRWGDGDATILDFYLAADGEPYPSAITVGQTITIAVSIKFNSDLIRPIIGIVIKTKEGVAVSGINSEIRELTDHRTLWQKGSIMYAKADFRCGLAAGDYFISVGVVTKQGEEYIPHDRRYDSIHFVVRAHNQFVGLADLGLNLETMNIHLTHV
jgi:lipopolysaccharide transport system ATP-binding protein